MTNADRIKALQAQIAAIYHKQATGDLRALVAELNLLQMPADVRARLGL